MWLPGDTWAGPGQSEVPCPHTYLSLECTLCPPFPQWEPFQGHSLREQCVVETTWTVYVAEPNEGLYVKFQDSGGQVQRSTCLLAPKTNVIGKPPCLSNCHLCIWSDLPLSLVSLCPPWIGAGVRFHWGKFQVCKPTTSPVMIATQPIRYLRTKLRRKETGSALIQQYFMKGHKARS